MSRSKAKVASNDVLRERPIRKETFDPPTSEGADRGSAPLMRRAPNGGMLRVGGPKPEHGRKIRTTRIIKEGAIEAASKVGYDGKGREGVVGWLEFMCRKYPVEYLRFFGRLIPVEMKGKIDFTSEVQYRTPEEVKAELKERGVTLEGVVHQFLDPNASEDAEEVP